MLELDPAVASVLSALVGGGFTALVSYFSNKSSNDKTVALIDYRMRLMEATTEHTTEHLDDHEKRIIKLEASDSTQWHRIDDMTDTLDGLTKEHAAYHGARTKGDAR